MKKHAQPLFDHLPNNGVQNCPNERTDDGFSQWGANPVNVQMHYESYSQFLGDNPVGAGPIEKNPNVEKYRDDFDLFRDILVLGPFPSSQYLTDFNLLDYYYADNPVLWDYLLELSGEQVTVENIRKALARSKISITDVYAYAQRKSFMIANPNTNLKNIVLNQSVADVFEEKYKIHTIFTFSGNLRDFCTNKYDSNTTKGLLWILEETGGSKRFEVSGDTNGKGSYHPLTNAGIAQALQQQNGGIIWWLKKGDKRVKIISLPSPSPSAAINMINYGGFFERWVSYKAISEGIPAPNEIDWPVLNDYLTHYPAVFGEEAITILYRRKVYQMALDGTLDQI